MSIKQIYFIFFCILTLFPANLLMAQISVGGLPRSFEHNFPQNFSRNAPTHPVVVLPALNMAQIREEDSKAKYTVRFAAPIKVNFTLQNSGFWTELDNGDRIWQLKVQSKGALALACLYQDFYLPPGATLFMYGEKDKQKVLGAYTAQNNKADKTFITGLIYDEIINIEYFEPKIVRGQGSLTIFKCYHAYSPENLNPPSTEPSTTAEVNGGPEGTGFGTSETCNVNINCTAGQNWQKQKRGVVRIMMTLEEGMGWCSGTLVNNTAQNGRPFVLTAFHCQDGYTPLYSFWTFDFNYESANCANPSTEPTVSRLEGCVLRSGRQQSDFLLLEMILPLPSALNPYFNGWNRSTTFTPTKSTMIHHPNGDIKKISYDTSSSATIYNGSIRWNTTVVTPANHHFKINITNGTTQVGSSGSPLFDQNGLVIGQFNGGNIDAKDKCKVIDAYFGRLAMSWEGGGTAATRLKDWLDPSNTGSTTISGIETAGSMVTISGRVLAYPNNTPMPNIKIYYSTTQMNGDSLAGKADSILTDANGAYKITIRRGASLAWTARKANSSYGNGVSTFDMVIMRKHILDIEAFTSPYQWIAADANRSNSVSTIDIVVLRQLVLGLTDSFMGNTAWRFIPSVVTFDAKNPFSQDVPEFMISDGFTKDTSGLDFIGVKIGDLNGSVDLNKN